MPSQAEPVTAASRTESEAPTIWTPAMRNASEETQRRLGRAVCEAGGEVEDGSRDEVWIVEHWYVGEPGEGDQLGVGGSPRQTAALPSAPSMKSNVE